MPKRVAGERALVVAEDPLARSGLASIIGAISHISERDGIAARARAESASIIVWDLGVEPRPQLDRWREIDLDLPIIALLPDPGLAAEAYALGARGLLLRDGDPERLVQAIAAVARGMVVIEEAIAATVFAPPKVAASNELLTPRELEVLELLARGLSNKLIGSALGISDHTAKFHVNAIMAKLGAETRTEAVVIAARLGLVAL